jgi:hypothetical protein
MKNIYHGLGSPLTPPATSSVAAEPCHLRIDERLTCDSGLDPAAEVLDLRELGRSRYLVMVSAPIT